MKTQTAQVAKRVVPSNNPPRTDADHAVLMDYLRGLKPGERVQETDRTSCLRDRKGTIYLSASGGQCVMWDRLPGERGQMGTSVTGGTRRVDDLERQAGAQRRKADELVVDPFSYADNSAPGGYECGECGALGVRLYRDYSTFLDHQTLLCRACACRDEKAKPDGPGEHCIKWRVAAVPTEDGTTYWGYTSVPSAGVAWWDRLPKI